VPLVMQPAPSTPCTVVGEATLGSGKVRVVGSAFPDPQPMDLFGVDGYALTPNGARLLLNALDLTPVVAEPGAETDAGLTEDTSGTPVRWALLVMALGVATIVARRR